MDLQNKVIAREMKEDELEMGLRIRNSVFRPLSSQDWHKGDKKTAVIAFSGEEAVGFIPLYMRKMKLMPGIEIDTVFESAVGTRQEYRGQGIGTIMIDSAKEFLKGKEDALFVYRSSERSQGYNFYKKTGHVDLQYTRIYKHESTGQESYCCKVNVYEGVSEILKKQDLLLEAFEGTYSSYGGFPPRRSAYWESALNASIYVPWPVDFYFLEYVENNSLKAYMIAGKNILPRNQDEIDYLYVFEIGALSGSEDAMKSIFETACAFSYNKHLRGVLIETGEASPFNDLLTCLWFVPGIRHKAVLAQIPDSEALFKKVWKNRFNLPGVELKVWTPEQDFVMLKSQNASGRSVIIEMKKETLTRWLMGRIDFKSRVREGTITIMNGNDEIVNEIAKAIPHCRWDYHYIDHC